jgi:sarcosine oxidase
VSTTTSRCLRTSTTVTPIPDFEYAVAGLGGLGSAAAYHLARRVGDSVVGIEQFSIGHDRGASQDHSRIIRLSYHAPEYVALARAAYRAWKELEQELGDKLFLRTGGLDLWPSNSAIPMSDYTTSLTDCGIDFELLDAREIQRRWPQFKLPNDVDGLFQAEGGIVPAARCNAAHIELARAHGATLLQNRRVESLRPVGDEIEVAGRDFNLRCRKLVIAADAWTNDLLAHLGLQLPLTVTQEQVTYFAPERIDDFTPGRFPVWIWMDDPSFYGVPIYGEVGVKVGQDVGGREVTPDTRTFETDEIALERVISFSKRFIPGAIGAPLYTKTCLYTMPPDRDFIVDTAPGHPNVVVVQGAAHAFKFASVVGKIASELAIDGATDHDLRSFRIDRPALLAAGSPKNFSI